MAELHSNQYPYPDECVYLVTGGKVINDSIDLGSISTLIIVGRNPESVSECWLQEMKIDGIQVLSCASLAQMVPFLSRLKAATANADGLTKVPAASFFRFGQSVKQPWLVGLSDGRSESTKTEVVIAQAAEDIEAWAGKRGLKITTALNLSMLESAVYEMKKVQSGTSEEEIYAEGPQDVQDMVNAIANRTKEEVQESLNGFARRMALYHQGAVQ